MEYFPPKLEDSVGLSAYKTSLAGVGGRLKQQPEDFVVEEVTADGVVLGVGGGGVSRSQALADYTVFTLEKNNWDTMRAVKEISKRVGVSRKRFSFAGTKDKKAVSTQRVSAYRVPVEKLEKVSIRDMELRDFGFSDHPVELGDLSGNRFTITVRGINLDKNCLSENLAALTSELSDGFPNFFGLQRFGITRPITHLVGKKIVLGDIEGAVLTYLCGVFEGEEEESFSARKRLRDEGNFKEALGFYPKHLGYELSLINHLVEKPGDFEGAIRRLPKGLQLMFVHAYQSSIFNRALSDYLISDKYVERLPLIGYETTPDSITKNILEYEGISPKDFRLRSLSELSSKGTLRECFEYSDGFKIVSTGLDELNDENFKTVLRFKLNPGVYATVFLREFLKNEYWLR